MSDDLASLAKLVARQIRKGQHFSLSAEMGQAIARIEGGAEELVLLLAEEVAKARPNAKLQQVYETFLADVLVHLVEGARAGNAVMQERLLNVEALIGDMLQEGELAPEALLMFLRHFQAAGHVPVEAIREAMMSTAPPDAGHIAFDGIAESLEQAIQEMGSDIFLAHQGMSPMLSSMPVEARAALGFELLTNERHPAVRDLALAWLFDEAEMVRKSAAEGIRQSAEQGRLTPGTLRRLILSRNLLSPTLHPDIDKAIKVARVKGVDCPAVPTPVVVEYNATGVDGAGAQSLFVHMKQGRKQMLVSILFKLGHGVIDAWVKTGMSKAEISSVLDELDAHMGANLSGPLYLRQAIGHFLSLNVETGQTIPFGFLQAAEMLALPSLIPEKQPISRELLRTILDELPPALTDANAFEQAQRISAGWAESAPFMASWFESDPAIDRLLKGKKLSRQKQVEAILQQWLPHRRDRWIEVLTRTGLAMREGDRKDLWVDYLLLARALADGHHPSTMPIMKAVAINTVEAWRYHHARR